METEKLFAEFPPVPTEKWEEVIHQDLKGADYEKKMVWKTNEGIKIQPYYRAESLENLKHLQVNPGEFPYIRGNKKSGNHWEIRQDVQVYDIASANKEALEALERGATAICFVTNGNVKSATDVSQLIHDIHFGCIVFNLQAGADTPQLAKFLVDEANKKGYDLSIMEGCLNFNPIGLLTGAGNWIDNEANDIAAAKELVETYSHVFPKYRILSANGCVFKESGASIVQEMAFTLTVANEYLCKLTDLGLSVDMIAPRIQFNLATGSNYFMEIAKIRAFRYLWAKLTEAYNPKSDESSKAFIHCSTAKWNMSVYDPHVNMLRATTQSMSCVIGGADSVSVKPFDAAYAKANSFSNRISRNTQIVLKEEAYLDRIADPAAGSYYIENLTGGLIDETWKLFLKVQEEGGYIQAFMKGFIQTEIETVANKKVNDIANRRETVLGTNQYPIFKEQVLKNIDFSVFEAKQNISKNPIARPLMKFRGSQVIENIRLTTEKSGKRPKVFMLTIGNLAMRLARSQFSCNFFAVAGFEVQDNNGFKTIDEGLQAAFAAKADIIVLCSSDDEYATLAVEAHEKLDNNLMLVIAGAPACQPELEAKGIKNFINIKSNVFETLKYYQLQLNIK